MQILLKTRALINRTGKYCGRRRLARAGMLVLNGGKRRVTEFSGSFDGTPRRALHNSRGDRAGHVVCRHSS
jgi:hypothetical protein